MKTQAEFLKMLKDVAKKTKGSKSEKQAAAWHSVYDTVYKGEEEVFHNALLTFKGLTKNSMTLKIEEATKRIDNAFNSKETQKHLKAMHGDDGFYSNIALD